MAQKDLFHKIACEVVRSLRGKRSQAAIDRRMKVNFSRVQRWESGATAIRWTQFLEFAALTNRDGLSLLASVMRVNRSAIDDEVKLFAVLTHGLSEKQILQTLGGKKSRALRWLSASYQPRLSDVLALLEVGSHILADFLFALGCDNDVPAAHELVTRRRENISLHCKYPYIGALVHLLELKGAPTEKKDILSYLAHGLGHSLVEVSDVLNKLEECGWIKFGSKGYTIHHSKIDLRGDLDLLKATRIYWMKKSLTFLSDLEKLPDSSRFGYLVFPINPQSFKQISELYSQFIQDVRILAESCESGQTHLGLLSASLIDFSELSPEAH